MALPLTGLLLLIAFHPVEARAEAIPDYVLDKDYVNCMGGENPQPDPKRKIYCDCIRDNMRGWSLDAYGQVAEQESKAKDAKDLPAKLEELAQICIGKAMNSSGN